MSNRHAYFTLDVSKALARPRATGLTVTDAGSKNDTRLNGHRLPQGEARDIEVGDLRTLGGVTCEVLDADTLHIILRRLL